MGICVEEDDRRIVEETWVYPVYQSFFIITYLAVSIACGWIVGKYWLEKKKVTLNTNRYQVIFCLCIGAFVRALSFIDMPCTPEELFRFLKDVFWMAAFVLIVLFWVELQTHVARMQGIEKLRPWLIAIMAVYCTFRFAASIAELYADGLKNLFTGLTTLVYLSVMFIGQFYGQKLLKKMKGIDNVEFKRQLLRLTVFIILENVVLLFLLLVFVIRTFAFESEKESHPWQWFYLKQVEKALELMSIIVLCLTMTGSGGKKKKAAAPVAATGAVKRRRKKPAATDAGAGASGSGEVGTTNPMASTPGTAPAPSGVQVEMKPLTGKPKPATAPSAETRVEVAEKPAGGDEAAPGV